jgi:hypothetical protein
MPELTFHGYFGRFTGDASKPIDFLSNEWTQVRNTQHKGGMNEKILKSSCNWKFAKSKAKPEVAPREQVAYHVENKKKIKGNKKSLYKMSVQWNSQKLEQKKFGNYISNLTEHDIELKLKELLKNEIKLQEERETMTSSVKSAKVSLECSIEVIKAQQKLYKNFLEFEMKRSSAYWNYVMGNHSFHNFETNPLRKETDEKSKS